MKWISDLKIKYKLILLLLLPVLLLVFLSGSFISDHLEDYSTLKNLQNQDSLVRSIDKLIEAMLIESNASIFVIKKNSTSTSKDLLDARRATDTSLENFNSVMGSTADVVSTDEIRTKLDELLISLKQLPQIRSQVDSHALNIDQVAAYYGNNVEQALDMIGFIGNATHAEIRRLLYSYTPIIEEIKGIRVEDYAMDLSIYNKKFTPDTFAKFVEGLTTQKNYKTVFGRRAGTKTKQFYATAMRGQSIEELDSIAERILANPFDQEVNVDEKIWDKLLDDKISALRSVKDHILDEVVEYGNKQYQHDLNSLLILLGLLLLALLVSIFLAYIIVKSISEPLVSAVAVAEAVSKGDLTAAITPSGRKDEIGALEVAWYTMIENLKKLTSRIQEGINALNKSAKGIMESVVEASSGTEETAVAVAETTTTVEELKQSADLSTAKAKDVVGTTLNVVKVLEDSEKSIHATIDGMTVLQDRMIKISESIQKLSEQSQEISEINNTVKDFAEQSNLLAINAGIEAAKAGEQGKGFSVVAEEIGNLAKQSKQATKNVHTILKDVQNAISAVVMTTEQGMKAVDQGIVQSTHTNESLRSLTDSIGEAERSANQIESSSRQQLIGVQQVTIAMNNIKDASSSHVIILQEIRKELEELYSVGEKLEALIHSFRL